MGLTGHAFVNEPYLVNLLEALVAGLFLIDAVLILWLWAAINNAMKTKPATGITRLLKMVDLNVFTNSVTFIAYVLYRLFGILDVSKAQQTGWLFTLMTMAL